VEPKGFHAQILEFPGCYAQGDTLEEAYSNLQKAAESWIDVALAQGHEIPEPSGNITYSGRIVLRLPRSIHRQAAELARRDETSLNTFLVSAVAAKVGAEDFYNALERRFVTAVMPFVNHFATTATNTQKLSPRWKPEQVAVTTIRPPQNIPALIRR
jgi:antitoxin HicB